MARPCARSPRGLRHFASGRLRDASLAENRAITMRLSANRAIPTQFMSDTGRKGQDRPFTPLKTLMIIAGSTTPTMKSMAQTRLRIWGSGVRISSGAPLQNMRSPPNAGGSAFGQLAEPHPQPRTAAMPRSFGSVGSTPLPRCRGARAGGGSLRSTARVFGLEPPQSGCAYR
jgi:hypothetical protein